MSAFIPWTGDLQSEASRALTDEQVHAMLRLGGKARQAAIGRLYARYGRDFQRYFRRHGIRDGQIEDLLQETFVRVLRGIDGWTGTGPLEAWLWAVARNTLMSFLREVATQRSTSWPEEQGATEETSLLLVSGVPSDPADTDCVRRGLAGFAATHAEQAHVLERIILDGWGYEELAHYRGCALGAAREYVSQCRKRVWQYIGHCYQVGAA